MSNPFFNANLYLAKNPDLAAAGLQTPAQLWAHYVNYGAQESLTVANRAPNSWFDASFYLSTNADLGVAGITAATALDHYYQYGVNEGRLFNPNANLAPANFSANTYALQNPDLVAVFGIVNPNNPSAAEAGRLQQHFLAYGYNEGRPGVNATFANLVLNVNSINLDPILGPPGNQAIAYGTVADDAFMSTASVANKIVNGLGGTDSITFGAASVTGAGAGAVKLQNIEKVIAANAGAVEFQSNKLLDVQINAAMGTVKAVFDAAAVVGQNDHLNVMSSDVTTNFTTNGIEHLNMALGNTVTSVIANANQASGSSLVIDLNGGSALGVLATIGSTGSTALTNLTIDGSDLTGALNLAAFTTLAALQNITIYGSSANVVQNFTVVAGSVTGQNLTIEGGAGVDTFSASTAIDLFKGNGGNDIFNMVNAAQTKIKVTGAAISSMDTIADFTNGDKITNVAAQIVTGTGTVPTTATLEDLVTGAAGGLATGDVFGFGGSSYILVAKSAVLANVSLVKIAGVDISALKVTGGTDVEFI